VTEGQAAIGVLPMPDEAESDPWWRHLLSAHDDAPHVIARLPFGPRGNGRTDGGDALAIGRGNEQPTGKDRTLIATENAPDISRGRLFSTLAALDLRCTFMAFCDHSESTNTLIEIDGFVPFADSRLERFRTQLGSALYRMLRLGSYAVPLAAAEMAVPQLSELAPAGGVAAALKG
jgi:hypothetical protein